LDYPLRTLDVAAFQRLVVLAYQVRAQGISLKELPAFMVTHPEWSRHPIDGVPFALDSTTGEIRVISQAKPQPGHRFNIRVVQAAIVRQNPESSAPPN